MGFRLWLGVAAAVTAALLAGMASRQADRHVVDAAFWFDGVTFETSVLDAARGGPLTGEERAVIQTLARDELQQAYAPWRLRIVAAPPAHYGVRVVQQLAMGPGGMAAAASQVVGPFGGSGAIGFHTLAALAVGYAPPGTPRAALVEAIGRGLGRVAAHELAHQILPHHDFHVSRDEGSYDFAAANRTRQFFGPVHWDIARPWLAAALGPRADRPATP